MRARLLIVAALVLGLALPASASAAAWGVDNPADTPIGQACPGFTGCSLREAITSTSLNPGPDAILVSGGTYVLANGELPVDETLSISQVGAFRPTIDAATLSRVFNATAPLTLSNLTITRGSATGDGGAILTDSNLTLSAVSITSSTASSAVAARGGAIFTSGGTLTVGTSTLASNLATGLAGNAPASGGAIYAGVGTTLIIGSSTLSDNQATAGSIPAAQGGAVQSDGTSVTITNSRLRDNTATGAAAGGGALGSTTAAMTIARTTFDGNRATATAPVFAFGGAITTNASLSLTNSTITANAAEAAAGGIALGGGLFANGGATIVSATVSANSVAAPLGTAAGGGIATSVAAPGVAVSLTASILSGNVETQPHADCANATLTSGGGGNVVDQISGVSGCTYSFGGDDVFTADPGLLALGDYGGPTPTMGLQTTSPALDRAPGACATATDQRGIARPQLAGCDAGAFEARPAAFVPAPTSRSFGTVPMGTSSAAQTVTVTNAGDLAAVPAPALGGADPGEFSLSGCASAVAGGANCALSAFFSPTSTGAKAATIDGLSASVALGGTGGPAIPTCTPAAATTAFQTAVAVPLSCAPAPVSWAIVTPPAHGTLSAPGATVTYTPDPGFTGADSFTFTATNGSGTSPAATAAVAVAGPAGGPIPTCEDVDLRTPFETPVATMPRCSANFWGWSVVDAPRHGTVVPADDGALRYLPDPGFSGTDTFTFRTAGARGLSAPATVRVIVGAAPAASAAPLQAASRCPGRRVTVGLNPGGERYVRVRARVEGLAVPASRSGERWTSTFTTRPGVARVVVRVSARRPDGRLVHVSRTLAVC